MSAADLCSCDTNDTGLVRGSWLQLRPLAGDYCSHSASRLVNGAWGPRKGLADCWRPTSLGSDWWGSSRLPGSRRSVGPVVLGPYRQAAVGAGLRLLVVTSGVEWQQCRAVRRSPPVRCTVATPILGPGGMGYTVATPCLVFLDEGAGFVGATGRLLGAGFSGSRPLGVGLS